MTASFTLIRLKSNLYRVDHQCCPGGNCLETPWGSPDFLAKSLANPDKIFKKNAKKIFFLARGLRGVSGQFPPGQHCWSTRYKELAPNALWFTYQNLKSFKPHENTKQKTSKC